MHKTSKMLSTDRRVKTSLSDGRRCFPRVTGSLIVAVGLAIVWSQAEPAHAQSSSIYARDLPLDTRPPTTLDGGSWTYIPRLQPRQIRINDRVTIRVDELARVQAEGEMERRKDALYDARLQDWVRLIGLKALKPAVQADGDPRVRGQLQQLFRTEGDMQSRESLALNLACTVADIRPNGDLVLEGHKQIRVNDEVWEVSLSGICRHEDVGPDNVVLSRNIVDMKLDKRERGHVRDSYKRGWFVRWLDEFHPF